MNNNISYIGLCVPCTYVDTALCIALWSLTWSVLMGYNDSSLSKSSTFSQKQVLLQHAQRREWWWDGRYFYHCPYKLSKGPVFHQQSSCKPDAWLLFLQQASLRLWLTAQHPPHSLSRKEEKIERRHGSDSKDFWEKIWSCLLFEETQSIPTWEVLKEIHQKLIKFAAAVRLDSQSNFLNDYFS